MRYAGPMTEAAILSARDGIAVVTVDNPPVNALSAAVRRGLQARLREALADDAVHAVVIACAGRTFFAGADITEFGRPPEPPPLPELVDEIEAGAKPVVAAIHGTALGGGLEVALACHFRIAVPSARVGLPEVKLGLIPGAGGTQRLPRLVGVELALQAVTSGEPVAAGAAAAAGLIDRLAREGSLLDDAVAFAAEIVREGRAPRRTGELEDRIASARGRPELFAAFRQANARRLKGLDAPEAAIQAIEAAVALPFAEGLKHERELFAGLMAGPQSKALRHLFFAERQAAKVAGLPEDAQPLPMRKVGVVGAGTMGGGISMALLNAGLPVVLAEVSPAGLERGLANIRRNYEGSVQRGRMTAADVESRLQALDATLDFGRLADCDLVIEAVFEEMEVKTRVFAQLSAIVRPDAILASNTSYLDVDRIADSATRPEQVLGLHFFSPANVMRLLEIVRARRTSPEVLAAALQLARRMGKVPVVVGVAHGFVGNRMLSRRQDQANRLILEGALPWDVDRVHVEFGMPMGPFQMIDLAGLDLGWTRERSTGSTVGEILCEMDRRGQKTGAGFYDYGPDRKGTPSPVVEKIILDFSAREGIERRAVSDREILERCLYPMISEGAQILDEGKAQRASDIDVVWIYGYGFPAWRGGPMFHADAVGLPKIVEALDGYGLEVAPLLRCLAGEGKGFKDL
jgi:3-hydroxyacyl-CoA dehydrogenase